MNIKDFGTLSDGRKARLFILKNDCIEVSVSDYGASLISLFVPDKNNHPVDIVLGFDSVLEYETDAGTYIGCNVGRNANRIGSGKFVLNGITYNLDKNDGEKNNLHSGLHPYSKRLWTVEESSDNSITFSLESPHMDQGFPGNLKLYINYTLTDKNQLKITYEGTPDADTVINVTNHSYFNLNGQGNGDILNLNLTVFADNFTPTDQYSIPTGEIKSVNGTPMDFRNSKPIGQDIAKDYMPLKMAGGYDHNWCINNYDSNLQKVIKVTSTITGITMEMETDYPGVQIYTANYISNVKGKSNSVYQEKSAVCFEPQFFPDAVNHENFPQPICKAGEKYHKEIVYTFDSSTN